MREPATQQQPFYVTGGTLKPGTPSYVERRADTELFESLLSGDFSYVLAARQTGKSSLMARTAKRLEQVGIASAIVDLTQIGGERGDLAAAPWYFGMAHQIHRQMRITTPLRPWWQERSELPLAQRLTDFFREIVLATVPGRIVIFVDEIDSTIGLPFAADFFAALRAHFNARATDSVFERLTFVLLGVATPDQLIQDPERTPFNIGTRIDLTDFSPDEARVLALGLHPEPEEAERRLNRILYWTGGHPYLTQVLCRAVRERGSLRLAEEAVDHEVQELFLASQAQGQESNLRLTRARLEGPVPESRRLLQIYRRVRQGKSVRDQPTSPLFARLKLAGIVKTTTEGQLAVRNRIYEAVFTPEWIKQSMPGDPVWRLAAGVAVAVMAWYAILLPSSHKNTFQAAIEDNAYNVALEKYTDLRSNPFSRSEALEMMQKFWARRALRYAQAGLRGESLLSYLQALSLMADKRLGKQSRNLVGSDYERLCFTFRHGDTVRAVAFSPDGRTLVTGSDDFNARLWDPHTGKFLESWGHEDAVRAVAFSPDGKVVVTGSEDGVTRLWEMSTRQTLVSLESQASVIALAFPDSRTVWTWSADETASLWSFSGKRLKSSQLPDEVTALAFGPDGQSVATGSPDNEVRLRDTHSGDWSRLLLNHQNRVRVIAFSPDGQRVATGSEDGVARLWDARTGELLASLKHPDDVTALAFSPDGQRIAAGASRTARLWDVRTGKLLAPPLRHQGGVTAVAFSPDGWTLATGSDDYAVRLWDARPSPGEWTSESSGPFGTVALSPDGQAIAFESESNKIQLMDVHSSRPLVSPLHHQGAIMAIAFSPDGQKILTGSRDNTASLWDVRSGMELVRPLRHEKAVTVLAFSPGGQTAATGSLDKIVRLWDVPTGKHLVSLKHRDFIIAVAFSPDGRILATAAGALDKSVRLWNALSGQELEGSPLDHDNPVDALAFAPDGHTLLTGSQDFEFQYRLQLWDIETGDSLASSFPLQGAPQTIAFNPTGTMFFVATGHWLNTFSWDGKKATARASQLLPGLWQKGLHFPSDCDNCLQVVLGDTGNSLHLETLQLDGPTDPPIEGDPKELLETWKARLGLRFDEQMRPVTQ